MSRPAIAPEALAELTAFARALCVDRHVTVEPGDHSQFDSVRHVIGIDVDPLSEPERARGLLAHECGHVLISRYHLWSPPTLYRGIWSALLNTLEDPRVDGWMIRRFPGSLAWFDAVADDIARRVVAPPTSLFQQFSLAAAAIDHRGSSHLDRASWFHPAVAEIFDTTRAMRRRYCEEVPELSLGSAPVSGASAIRLPLASEIRGAVAELADGLETSVRRSAYTAWRIARDEILPAVRPLIDRDVARIVAFAQRDGKVDRILAQGDRASRIAAVRAALLVVSPDSDDALAVRPDDDTRRKNAMRAFDDFIAHRNGPGAGGGPAQGDDGIRRRWMPEGTLGSGDREPPDAKPRDARAGAALDPDEIERRFRTQVAELRATLEAIMTDRRRARWRSGFRSGGAPDLRRLMRFDADRRDDRVWKRMLRHHEREGVLGLLVDLSGSMAKSSKIEAAIAGTRLFAEAASGAQIDFLIDGFQDVLIPVASIGERCTPALTQRIAEMALEVRNRRPGGNNAAGHNDDGPCLDAFADKLLARAGRRNLLLVISDGLPEGRHSTPDDLRRSVARLSARSDLTIIGLGLGAGTSHVRDYYPVALADVPVARLGAEIGRILQLHCRAM